MESINIFWFRRDLRLEDNTGLYHALCSDKKVLPVFIFDKTILDQLSNKADARVAFIHTIISNIKKRLQGRGRDLLVYYGQPSDIWTQLMEKFNINEVFFNHDYESYAIARDKEIGQLLEKSNISYKTYKDHVLFEKDEIVKDDDKPYTVFTPYKRKWLARMTANKSSLDTHFFKTFPSEEKLEKIMESSVFQPMISLDDMGFKNSEIDIPSSNVSKSIILRYDVNRDFPALDATSKLGIHYRFGTISIREKAEKATSLNQTYLNELIWRDFYAMILYHFPHVEKNSFRSEYDNIEWRNNEEEFSMWCEGKTGYPIVDAGMRQLLKTGYMHNRVRMIVASFLTKHLLIDWRWGEAWFAEHLLDFDLASNNGGWQWAAGCGTDAAPYFRIFSPLAQAEKFDKKLEYIKKWVPEYETGSYPKPIVDHKMARERCLQVYKKGLGKY